MAKSIQNSITHVIFDMDGTVVDSESLLFKALDNLCEKNSISVSSEIKEKLFGHPFKERALQLYRDLGFERIISFNEFVKQLITDCRENVDKNGMNLMEGIESLVEYFKQNSIQMGIASGNDRKSYEETVKRFHPFFEKYFSFAVLSGDENEKIDPKPSPHIYVKAFERFSPKPESLSHCLVFEDTEVGVLSAITAGMKCIHVLDKRLNSSSFGSNIASKVINSLTEFSPKTFGLP